MATDDNDDDDDDTEDDATDEDEGDDQGAFLSRKFNLEKYSPSKGCSPASVSGSWRTDDGDHQRPKLVGERGRTLERSKTRPCLLPVPTAARRKIGQNYDNEEEGSPLGGGGGGGGGTGGRASRRSCGSGGRLPEL